MENINANEILEEIYSIGDKLYGAMCSNNDEGHREVFTSLTELGRTLVDADRASFWKWDKETHKLWTTSATGTDKIEIPEDKGLVGKALKEKRVIVTNDPYSEPEFNREVDKQTGYLTMSVLVMPVASISGEYIGAFQMINKLGDSGFDEVEDVKKLSLAAFVCGIALESVGFFEDSLFDKLTGLKNRKAFYNDFENTFKDYLKPSRATKLSMFICDLDRYKKVNDNYGHNAGDDALKFVTDIMRKHIREGKEDDVYRWGGDEFIMMLPDCDIDKCREIGEAVRKEVKETLFKANGVAIHLSLSVGCIEYDMNKSIEENIAAADDNLFVAKDSGRNKVC